MQDLWKVAISVSGIGAIGAFVMWSLYRNWLKLDIFQRMTKKQQFRLFVLFMTFTFLFAIASLVVYIEAINREIKIEQEEHARRDKIQKELDSIKWKIDPSSYQTASKIPVGAHFAIQLKDTSTNTKLKWSKPSLGKLNSLSGDNVCYTAKKVGRDKFTVTMSSSGISVKKDFVFNITSPITIPQVDLDDSIEPSKPPVAPPFAASVERLKFQAEKETFAIRNDYTEPLFIDTIQFNIRHFEVDKTPALQYHILQLFDCLVVFIQNVGWGTYYGETFSLFPENAVTSDGRHSLSDLFDIESPTVPLTEVSDKALLAFRLGPDHAPFIASFVPTEGGLIISGVAEVGKKFWQRPVVLDHPLGTLCEIPYKVTKFVGETRSRFPEDGETVKYDGSVLFDSRLGYGETSEKITYQPSVMFYFGQTYRAYKPVWETRVMPVVVGLTVDLGDGQKKELNYEINHRVDPGEELVLPLSFVAACSARFDTEMTCEYYFGTTKPDEENTYKFPMAFTGNIIVPRANPFGGDINAEELYRLALSAEPNLGNRAHEYLARTLDMDDEDWKVLLTDPEKQKKFTDAIELAMHSTEKEHQHLGVQVLTRYCNYSTKLVDNEPEVPSIDEHRFGMLCKYCPQNAAELAFQEYFLGHDDQRLLRYLNLDSVRPYLLKYLLKYSRYLKLELDRKDDFSNTDLAIAAILKHSRCEPKLLEMIRSQEFAFNDIQFIVWAATQLDSPKVNAALAEQIKLPELKSSNARVFFDALATNRNGKLIPAAIEFAEQASEKPEYVEGMIGCLHYLHEFPDHDTTRILALLTSYAQSYEVRKLAEELSEK